MGSFKCTCNDGYILDSDNFKCKVDDECKVKHDCDQICIKKRNGYDCKCKSGFAVLGSNQKCFGKVTEIFY